MNKRQAKKAAKKVTYPLVDEFNLLTLSPEEYNEYNKAIKDYHEYVLKHCIYKPKITIVNQSLVQLRSPYSNNFQNTDVYKNEGPKHEET